MSAQGGGLAGPLKNVTGRPGGGAEGRGLGTSANKVVGSHGILKFASWI